MRTVSLAGIDLPVSALAFGCMSLVPDKREQGYAAVRRALSLVSIFTTQQMSIAGASLKRSWGRRCAKLRLLANKS